MSVHKPGKGFGGDPARLHVCMQTVSCQEI
jgi:hypothetical protein